jgi:hypothetical protein
MRRIALLAVVFLAAMVLGGCSTWSGSDEGDREWRQYEEWKATHPGQNGGII